MSGINQKEYLKKYLGIGKGSVEKKKKKKTKKLGNGLKIVDDDIDVRLNEEIQVDLTADNDEAPQIVSVIDDRPPSLRVDEDTRSKLWKPIGVLDEPEQIEKSIKYQGNIKLFNLGNKQKVSKNKRHISPNKKQRDSKNSSKQSPKIKQKSVSSDEDYSPVRQRGSKDISTPRREKAQSNSDFNNYFKEHGDDDSSPRSGINKDISPPRKRRNSQDSSPPRKRQSMDMSPLRQTGRDIDSSPPRRGKVQRQDLSPSRKRRVVDSDSLPARTIKKEKDVCNSPPRRRQSMDMSPPRQTKADSDFSPPRGSKGKTYDLSPPRKGKATEVDFLPPRKIKRENSEDNSSPKRKEESNPARKRSRWGGSEETGEKMEKTLDGKTAGLQNAADLVQETKELKKREDELFKKLSSEISGANAATVVRRKHNDVDLEEEERKQKIEEENKEKYNRWGKGLKQVEDVNEKIRNDLYEMSKPLARYADDEDLEKHLKEQEREGDPMLAYMRQKKRKKAVEHGTPVIQQYEGDAPPNRFGIRPGYRWDGVDRSNGYEKKWFEVQNSRKASIEENYKWSTEDM